MKGKESINQRSHHGMRNERGVISIFLAGVLLLTSFSTGVMMDFVRLETGKAEARSGLRLASHQALSGFHKKMAREFGLFAVENVQTAEDKADAFFRRRWQPDKSSFAMVRLRAADFTLTPTEGARLSRPQEMEKQISEFMEWQLPQAVLGKVGQHLELLRHLSQTTGVMQEKMNYEKELHSVQNNVEDVSSHFEKLSEVEGKDGLTFPPLPTDLPIAQEIGEKIFTGIPAMGEEIKKMESQLSTLDQSLSEKLAAGIQEKEINPNSVEEWKSVLSASDRLELRKGYEKVQSGFRDTQNWWKKWDRFEKSLETSLDSASESIDQLEGSASSWKGELDALPDGSMTQNLLGDYLAETSLHDTESLKKLKSEFSDLAEQAATLKEAWSNIKIDDVFIADQDFDGWLNTKISSITSSETEFQFPSSKLSYVEPKGWSDGIAMSEDHMKTQAALLQMGGDRASLWEVIQAMWKKHKLIADTRRAQRAGLPDLAGGIESEMSSDALARFRADAVHIDRGDLEPVSVGREEATVDGVMNQMNAISHELTTTDLPESESRILLITYWATMFSHRTTSLLEEKEGKTRLSLNGFPLHDRPEFSGELEFILHGRPDWMTNIKQTEYRIAALRLMCNMAYAFSSSELYTETSQLATALAGWTGFAVPFVQSSLLVVLAIGETALDMDELTAGESVPLMKTPETWRFSIDGVSEMASEATKDVFTIAEDEMLSLVEASAETIHDSLTKVERSAQEQAESAVREPTLRLMEQLLRSPEMPDEQKLSQTLQNVFSALAERGGSGKMGEFVSQSFHSLEQQSGTLARILSESMKQKQQAGLETEAVMTSLQQRTNDILSSTLSGMDHFVSSEVSALENEIRQARSGAENHADEQIQKAFQNFRQKVGFEDGNGNVSVNAGLSMDYEDYVLLFLVLYSATEGGKDAMLSHTAQLVQVETGAPDLTLAPTSIDWTLQADLDVLFFPLFPSTEVLAENKKTAISESWTEGYGSRPRKEGSS